MTLLYLAPLQGYTDYAFRNAFCSIFNAPAKSFSPFIDTHKPDHRMYRDVLPERNTTCKVIPQIIGKDAGEMLPVIKELEQKGYDEVNLNLGCPYPMVTKKGMGAGLLATPELIDKILENTLPHISCQFSVKMRLGLSNNNEWNELVPILNRYPLTEIIIHARNASQMYKGETDVNAFQEFASQLKHPVCYNGDILSLDQFNTLNNQLKNTDRYMIGRGILSNPLLYNEIQTGITSTPEEICKAIEKLHNSLLVINSERLNGQSHVFNKMKPYWEYFAAAFKDKEKGIKKIKKSQNLELYRVAVNEIFKFS
jgi:tRNA-dihydrouridine synthase B